MNWGEIIIDAAETDTGVRRSINQDSLAIVRAPREDAWKRHGHMYVVADGMGAHAVGELASKMACENIPHTYTKATRAAKTPLPIAETLVKAFKDTCAQINAKSKANREFDGMGTTCSTLILGPEGALVAHVGDSRVYRVRDEVVDQLTFDHSLSWELKRQAGLPLDDDETIRTPRNVITRSLGPEPTVEVDVEGPMPVRRGDVFLLCSDGLSGQTTDHEIGVFAGLIHPKDAVRYLLHLANLRGGPDNITVVIVRVGPFVDPETGREADAGQPPAEEPRRFSLGGLLGSFKRAKPVEEEYVEEPYRSHPCPLTEEFLEDLVNLVGHTKGVALDQGWPLDWATFAATRKAAADARGEGRLVAALKATGECVEMLGIAKRLHTKNNRNKNAGAV